MSASTILSIADLLQSEIFSTSYFLLPNEATDESAIRSIVDKLNVPTFDSVWNDNKNYYCGSNRHEIENATRIALLLTRKVVQFFNLQEENNDYNYNFDPKVLASVQLRDFFVSLEHRKNGVSIPFEENDSQIFDRAAGSSRDGHLELEEDEKKGYENGEEDDAMKDQYGRGLGMGYFSSICAADENVPSQNQKPSSYSTTKKISNSKTKSSQNGTTNSPQEQQLTLLLDIDIISPEDIHDDSQQDNLQNPKLSEQQMQQNKTRTLQVLGCLLYAIFSKGDPQSFSDTTNSKNTQQRNQKREGQNTNNKNDNNNGGKRTKSQKTTESTIFYQLMGRNSTLFPISICRLLSDLLDVGGTSGKNKAHDPFGSFKDVICDLEQMVTHPEAFLYDSIRGGGSSSGGGGSRSRNPANPPSFGQKYHGQKHELKSLLDIADRMEEQSRRMTTTTTTRMTTTKTAMPTSLSMTRAEAVYISGRSGCGKSRLAKAVTEELSRRREWIVLKETFERDSVHNSQCVVTSIFNKIMDKLVAFKNSKNKADVEYSERACKAISDAFFDDESFSSLGEHIPSLHKLINASDNNTASNITTSFQRRHSGNSETQLAHWKLVFLLTNLMAAILSLDRYICITLDDIQWADEVALDLVTEIIASAGNFGGRADRLFFMGTFRDDAITENHPLREHSKRLRQNEECVNITNVKLASMSKEDVALIIANDLRLPVRLVTKFAEVIHKKTSGYVLYVTQLLNSLIRDSVIYYSAQKHRYDWSWDKIRKLKTDDGVASLIVSNLSLLNADTLQSLIILSCLGLQSHITLLALLDGSPQCPKDGIEATLLCLLDAGIIESAGPMIIAFSHDMIRQQVYESIPLEKRRRLHFELGLYLGNKTALDRTQMENIEASIQLLYVSETDKMGNMTTSVRSLASVATDQINHAGPDYIVDRSERVRFADWNLQVAKEASKTNFMSALNYYQRGITYIKDYLWSDDCFDLSLKLHEGAGASSFALGMGNTARECATVVIDNTTFEQSLISQLLLIRSLDSIGQDHEAIASGLHVLRKLKFDLPSNPTLRDIAEGSSQTTAMLSQFSTAHILAMRENTADHQTRTIFKLLDSLLFASFRQASPYYTLLMFAIIRYSLSVGFVAPEAAVAFASFGVFKINLERNFEAALSWGQLAMKIAEDSKSKSTYVRTNMVLCGHLNLWYCPLKELACRFFTIHEIGIRIGDVVTAMHALAMHLRISMLEGQNLLALSMTYKKVIKKIMKYDVETAKLVVNDKLFIEKMTGEHSDLFSMFGRAIKNEEEFLEGSCNVHCAELIQLQRFFSHFWMGDYHQAQKWSSAALAQPSSRRVKIWYIYHTAYRGIVKFWRYRIDGDEQYLREGRDIIDEVEIWCKQLNENFENKLLLLKAEYNFSTTSVEAAKGYYEASIKSAHQNGRVHEKALAYELMGKCLSSESSQTSEALRCFVNAHQCYLQWGANQVAARLCKDYNLDQLDAVDVDLDQLSVKRSRDRI